jgi:hypothetical protein
MAIQEDGQSFVISTSRGEATLSTNGKTWRVDGQDFSAVTAPGGTAREALKAVFGVAEGTRLSTAQDASRRERA